MLETDRVIRAQPTKVTQVELVTGNPVVVAVVAMQVPVLLVMATKAEVAAQELEYLKAE
jgi:hypothetical protein